MIEGDVIGLWCQLSNIDSLEGNLVGDGSQRRRVCSIYSVYEKLCLRNFSRAWRAPVGFRPILCLDKLKRGHELWLSRTRVDL